MYRHTLPDRHVVSDPDVVADLDGRRRSGRLTVDDELMLIVVQNLEVPSDGTPVTDGDLVFTPDVGGVIDVGGAHGEIATYLHERSGTDRGSSISRLRNRTSGRRNKQGATDGGVLTDPDEEVTVDIERRLGIDIRLRLRVKQERRRVSSVLRRIVR